MWMCVPEEGARLSVLRYRFLGERRAPDLRRTIDWHYYNILYVCYVILALLVLKYCQLELLIFLLDYFHYYSCTCLYYSCAPVTEVLLFLLLLALLLLLLLLQLLLLLLLQLLLLPLVLSASPISSSSSSSSPSPPPPDLPVS